MTMDRTITRPSPPPRGWAIVGLAISAWIVVITAYASIEAMANLVRGL